MFQIMDTLSDYFQLNRGIRQGCPISAPLFILVPEIIAISIRSEKNIKGIIQLADDTTLFLKNIKSLVLAIDLFKKFGEFSGLKLNIGKTEIVPLGQLYLTTNSLPKRLKNITIQTKLFKTLGIWFLINSNINIELNFTERLKTIEKSLFIWSARDLSWKGKITIIKSLIIPKFLHLFSSVYTPAKILDNIDKLLFNFLWRNKPPRVKRSTIINDIQNGGLKMPDIYTVHATQKLAWMKRLLDNSTKKWKVLSFSLICLPKDYIDFKLPSDRYHTAKTQFYQQLLNCWFSIKNKKPTTVDEILNEYLFYNRFILVNKSCLELSIVDNNKRLLQTKMIDLIKLDGSLLNFQDMSTKFSSQLTLMQYYSIIKAIPPNWKSKLKLFFLIQHIMKKRIMLFPCRLKRY